MLFKNKVAKNASWIISCRVAQSVLSLVIGMLTARFLGPSNYGVINYVASIVAFVTPIMYLGLNSTIVHELISRPDKEGEVLGTSILMSVCSAILCIIGVVSFVYFVNAGERETLIVCAIYSVLLVFNAIDLIQYWFQAKLMSKYTSVAMLIAYAVVSLYKIFLLVTQKSVYWFAASNFLDYALIALFLIVIYKNKQGQKLSFSKKTAGDLFSKSKYYIVSSMMVTIFAQTDKIMIKNMLGNEMVGLYTAAVTTASVLSFVFSAIIDSFRPEILKSGKEAESKFEKNMILLYSIIIYLSLVVSAFMTMFAPVLINILFGRRYIAASSSLQIIVWYTTFAYIGSVRNVWILARGLQKHLWKINLSGALLNVILNSVLIPYWGINGAAIASLVTQIFTNVVVGWLIKDIRDNNRLMFKGLNIKYILKR